MIILLKTLDSESIPFFPHWGYYPFNRISWDPDLVPQEPIQRLRVMLAEQNEIDEEFKATGTKGTEREILVSKVQTFDETKYFRYLESEHGIILKDYSNTFCKMELEENVDESKYISSGKTCYND